ncbi:MAG: galactokinase family protein [Candidatus Thorarchaeota archaeon]
MGIQRPFRVLAPGRVCLFGEHSDYLGLPVIPAAIDKTIEIYSSPRDDKSIKVNYVDLGTTDSFQLDTDITYRNTRDYLRSAFTVLSRRNIRPTLGADLRVSGDVPIAGGLSSSSALSVASVMTVAQMAESTLREEERVQLAFDAEVTEFGESGGLMDHFASVMGGIIHVDCGNNNILTRLDARLEGIIIGDSQEKKQDTVGDLRKIRLTVEEGYRHLTSQIDDFDHRETPLIEVQEHLDKIPKHCRLITETTIRNRNLTSRALDILKHRHPEPEIIGTMLNEHHALLRDGFERSTPKIERMIHAATKAGALGCKMNGSGGGGTILAFAPGNEEKVSGAIRNAGGVPFLTRIGQGASLTILRE